MQGAPHFHRRPEARLPLMCLFICTHVFVCTYLSIRACIRIHIHALVCAHVCLHVYPCVAFSNSFCESWVLQERTAGCNVLASHTYPGLAVFLSLPCAAERWLSRSFLMGAGVGFHVRRNTCSPGGVGPCGDDTQVRATLVGLFPRPPRCWEGSSLLCMDTFSRNSVTRKP